MEIFATGFFLLPEMPLLGIFLKQNQAQILIKNLIFSTAATAPEETETFFET